MAYIPGDIMQVKLQCGTSDQLGINLIHYRCLTTTAPTADGIIATDVAGQFATVMKNLIGSQANYLGVSITNIFPIRGTPVVSLSGAGAGLRGSILQATQTCGIVTKQTLIPGRAGRGRMYIPFPSTTDATPQGAPTTSYMTALNTLRVAMIGTFTPTTGTFEPIIFKRANPADSITIDAVRANPKFATQRRRGQYGRPNSTIVT